MSKVRTKLLLSVLIGLSMVCASAWGQTREGNSLNRTGERPFRGSAAGAVVNQIPPNGLEILTSGRATHLGRFWRNELLFLNEDGSFDGVLVFHAANGDQLHADVVGQFISQTTAMGQYYFTGGTGRFRNASGEADFEAITPDGIQLTVAFDGRIRY